MESGVLRQVYLAHPALAELLDDAIVGHERSYHSHWTTEPTELLGQLQPAFEKA